MKRTIKNPALVGYTFNIGHPSMPGADSWTIVNEHGQQEEIDLKRFDVELTITPKFQPGYYEAFGATHDVQWFDRPPNDPIWHRVKVTRDGD